jgi:hypothetical protein
LYAIVTRRWRDEQLPRDELTETIAALRRRMPNAPSPNVRWSWAIADAMASG